MKTSSRIRPPLAAAAVRKLKPVPALGRPPADQSARVLSTFLSFDKGTDPHAQTRFEHIRDIGGKSVWRIDLESRGSVAALEQGRVPVERRILRPSELKNVSGFLESAPHRPGFVGFNPRPARIQAPARPILRRRDGRRVEPLYVLPPDGRYAYHDHDYPWCCFGRVECANGATGSGVLIGPRHVLTASHILDWNAPWAVFRANFRGSHEHAIGYTWCVWYYQKYSPGVDIVDRDYVVLVLDQPLGQWFGYMGSRTYLDDWDDEPYWRSLGYEEDIGSATLPTYQQDFCLEEFDGGLMKVMITRDGDFTHAHSGGPVFAWWEDGWPYVVGVVSSGAEDEDGLLNVVSGGTAMVRMIARARAETP